MAGHVIIPQDHSFANVCNLGLDVYVTLMLMNALYNFVQMPQLVQTLLGHFTANVNMDLVEVIAQMLTNVNSQLSFVNTTAHV
jgi:HPt (histidine-containing phosphotransfer) domain-containing protein